MIYILIELYTFSLLPLPFSLWNYKIWEKVTK